jgi:hypothetical protein
LFSGSEDDINVAMPHPSIPGYFVFQTLDIVHILKALGVAFESSGKPLKYGTRILTKAVPTPTPDDPTKTTEYVMVKDELIHDYQAEQDASTEGRDHIGIQPMQLLSGSLVTRLEIPWGLLLVPMPMMWISMSGHMPLL